MSSYGGRGTFVRASGQAALALALWVSLVMVSLGIMVLIVTIVEKRSAVRQQQLDGVALAAESGIEYAQGMMLMTPGRSPYHGGTLPGLVNFATVTVSEPLFDHIAMDGDDLYHLSSTARRGRMWRRVEAEVEFSPDRKRCHVVSWKEYPTPPRRPRVARTGPR